MYLGLIGLVVLDDMQKLKGSANVGAHDAHYAPVAPISNRPNESVFVATNPDINPVFDELIVFQETQILPSFVVHYTV